MGDVQRVCVSGAPVEIGSEEEKGCPKKCAMPPSILVAEMNFFSGAVLRPAVVPPSHGRSWAFD